MFAAGEAEALAWEPAEPEADAGMPVVWDEEGKIARRVLTPKAFLDGAKPYDVIIGKPIGHVEVLGTISGEIDKVEPRTYEWPDPSAGGQVKVLTSYWLYGNFVARVLRSNERLQTGIAILPNAYGEQVNHAFNSLHVEKAQLGVMIGLKVTGRNIAHEWLIRDHMPTKSTSRIDAISRLLDAQLDKAKALPGPAKLKTISAK